MADSLPRDRDQELAARLADTSDGFPQEEDPLVRVLSAEREAYRNTPVDERAGARIWAAVDRATRRGAGRPALARVAPRMRLVWGAMATAAAITLLVVVPALLEPDERLLARAAGAPQSS